MSTHGPRLPGLAAAHDGGV
uniref:Uncharacterized protein n=1 Tax=Arundo donax TaxID=35708 RepID=A0A0A9A7Z9_ARUDO